MDLDCLRDALSPTRITQFRYFDTIGSTNDEALAWVDDHAVDYSLVIADNQTKGRGRFDRKWITTPGASLAFSLILKPSPGEKNVIPMFAPLCGVAIRDAINECLGLHPKIKWPNDVLLNRKKFCGVLVETSWTDNTVNGIVAGIGINIKHASIPPAENQKFAATSLEDETSSPINRYSILQNVLQSFEYWRGKLGTNEFMDVWQTHLAFKGEQVCIEHSGKPSIIGMLKGVNEHGSLVLLVDNNQEMIFEIGDVHLRPGASTNLGGLYAG